MEKMKGDNFRSLRFEDNRLKQRRHGFWSEKNEVIPLTKIDSIHYGFYRKISEFIFGIILLIIGIGVYKFKISFRLALILIIIGALLVAFGLRKHELVIFRAGTSKVSEKGEGAMEFAKWILDKL